jgi:hypothetical protein
VRAGGGLVAGGDAGVAEPEPDVALVGEQVLGLAEIFGCGERLFEVGAGGGGIFRERGAAEEKVRADVLAEGLAFAAFPGLELARLEDWQRGGGTAGLVVKRAELDAEVVAGADELGVALQFAETLGRFLAEALPELVALVEQRASAGLARKAAS